MHILNQEGFAQLSKYSGNPFLDALVDLQDVVNTIAEAKTYKPYIEKYSDPNLTDLKDKIKTYLPEAVGKDGSIDFNKIQELASAGNPLAEHILTIKEHRETFSKAPLGGKLAAIKNDALRDIISGGGLKKTAEVLKKSQQFDEFLKNPNIPDYWRAVLSANKEAFLSNPTLLALFSNIFTNTQAPTQQQTQGAEQADNTFNTPAMQSIQSIFNAKANDVLQSLIPTATPSTSATTDTTERKKQAIKKLKQIIETKKSKKQNKQEEQQQEQQPQQQQQTSGITFPFPATNLPIFPYGYIPPKITTSW
jgi:hypothetical protein